MREGTATLGERKKTKLGTQTLGTKSNGEFHWLFWSVPGSTFLERAYFTGRSGSRRTCSTGRLGLAPAADLDLDPRKVAPTISADSTGSQPGQPSAHTRDFLSRGASRLTSPQKNS
ncbi:unnamed protein product [Ixodes pacificus]